MNQRTRFSGKQTHHCPLLIYLEFLNLHDGEKEISIHTTSNQIIEERRHENINS